MSFYRSIFAALVAASFITPVFADDRDNTKKSDVIQISQSGDETTATVVNNMDQTDQANATTEQAKVNLNTADVSQLTQIKGLTKAKARAIVMYRKKHGGFKSLKDLAKVKGFKTMNTEKMKEIQNLLTIEG